MWDREAMLSNEFLGGVRLSSGKGKIPSVAFSPAFQGSHVRFSFVISIKLYKER